MDHYEEHEASGGRWGWALLILLGLGLVVWGVFFYATVRDVPRQWDTDALGDAPSETIYSTHEPASSENVPLMIAPLPEAQPLTTTTLSHAGARP